MTKIRYKFYRKIVELIKQKIGGNILILNGKLLKNLNVICDKQREVWGKCKEIKRLDYLKREVNKNKNLFDFLFWIKKFYTSSPGGR